MSQVEFRNEFGRFMVLQECLSGATNDWIAKTPKDKLDWIPVDNPNVRFGDRVSVVTIKSLYIHMAVEEYQFVRFLKDCENDTALPLPRDPDLTAKLTSGDFVGEAAKLHEESVRTLRGYTDEQLRKTVRFADRTWTVMGFLWALYAHRAYHLGNIDIYLRQSNTPAPSYFHFSVPAVA